MGRPFGPFVLERLLGRGGMAEVFLGHARGKESEPPVVIKRLRPEVADDPEHLKRLRLEATVASRIVHPNIVRVSELGCVGECHYLLMDYVRGHNLKRLLDYVFETDTPVPVAAATAIARGVLCGLSALHEASDPDRRARPIVHRDVTPGNIIITDSGQPIVIDFGIAKDVFGPAITQVGRIVGTARYMAPEHRMGQLVRPSADVFSVSMLLFELVSARHPWPPMTFAKEMFRTIFDPPELDDALKARIPGPLLEVLLRGLQHDAERRFSDARGMLDALDAAGYGGAGPDDRGTDALATVQAWVRSTNLASDEALNELVIDSPAAGRTPKDDGSLAWTPVGNLSADLAQDPEADQAWRPSQLPSANRLSIPALAPRLHTSLSQEFDFAGELKAWRSRRAFVVAAVSLFGIAVLGWVMFQFAWK